MITNIDASKLNYDSSRIPHQHERSKRAPEGGDGERLLAGRPAVDGSTGLHEHLTRHGRVPSFAAHDGEHPLIAAIARAGLTGRGGAGFPTATKLRVVAGAKQTARVVVANGMESEPASAKDKTLLRFAPHLVLDGIALAAEAVGAGQAHLCIAPSHSGLDRRLRDLVRERRERGIDPIEINVHTPPHHYVSSEASALTNWLGGGEARPTTTPPRTAERGVSGLPTLIDNVETLAHLALIGRYGPDWFRTRGTAESPGTALVTVGGAVAEPGVHEIGYGTTVHDILEPAHPARDAQAVLLGGYFGTWLPAVDTTRLEYSAAGLAEVGASAGAGVLAVLPSQACGLAETARVLEYLGAQSARQCGPCRFGLPATASDFARLAFGHCDAELRARIEDRIELLAGRGACKHPDGAARLAASALSTFAPDVRRHLESGPCPAALKAPPLLPTSSDSIKDGEWR